MSTIMSTESSPVQVQIDNLRLKQVMRQSCLNFGAVDTARRIKHSPEKLDVLFDLLISEDMVESAYLLAKSFLSEEAFQAFEQKADNLTHFCSIDKEELKVSKVKNELHLKLTGESYDETRKRERAERRQASKEAGAKSKSEKAKAKSSAKEDENQGKPPKAQKSTKESKRNNPSDSRKSKKDNQKSHKEDSSPKAEKKERVRKIKEAPTESPSGLPYLTLEEYGFTRANYFFVRSIKSFEKIKDHFLEQSVIGIDTQFQKGIIQAISIASEDKVAVFDLEELRSNSTITDYLTEILQSEKIEKIAHSFKLDAYYLSKLLGIEGTSIKNVIDLSANIVEETEESTRKIGLNKMTEKYLEKSLNQYYKKSNWSDRPFDQTLIDYVALNGFVVLKLFLDYSKNQDSGDHTYFEYEEPANLPEFNEGESTRKRLRSENRPSRNPKKGNEERSRRRRPGPRKPANEDGHDE